MEMGTDNSELRNSDSSNVLSSGKELALPIHDLHFYLTPFAVIKVLHIKAI